MMWQDLRNGFRSVVRQPGFATLATVVLALGVGLNIALFSVASALLLRPLVAVRAPEELVYIYRGLSKRPESPVLLSHRVYESLRAHGQAFVGLSGTTPLTCGFTARSGTEVLHGEQVQPDYFDVLGVSARLGRVLLSDDHSLTATESAVVISDDLWRRLFGADPAVLGKRVRLAEELEHDFTIVGVAPPGFRGISDPWTPSQFWVSAVVTERLLLNAPPGIHVAFLGLARLRPGVGVSGARLIVEALGRQVGNQSGGQERTLLFPSTRIRVPFDPMKAVVPTWLVSGLTVAVLMVLLVAASNVAGLLLARGVSRSAEIALRRALGASRQRLARQLVAESLFLAAAGGGGGLLLGRWLIALFHAFTPPQYALDASLDWRSALVSATLCAACGLMIGIVPGVQAGRVDILSALDKAATTTRRTPRRVQRGVVLPQVALSLALLLVAAVYVRTLVQVEVADTGYEQSGLVVVNTRLRTPLGEGWGGRGSDAWAERSRRYYQDVLARLQGLPFIGAALASDLPLHAPARAAQSTVSSFENSGAGASAHLAMRLRVSPGYFQAMGMQILRGRDFETRDTPNTPRVGIVSASVAARLWPGRDPVGRRASLVAPSPGARPEVFDVVGVVNDVQPILTDAGPTSYVYFSLGQQRQPSPAFVVARATDTKGALEQVRATVTAADPMAEILRTRTLRQMAAEILYPRRLAGALLVASSCAALLLACVGIYGVVSYSVAQRLGEIGVRRALGGGGRDIAWLVIGEGLRVATAGSLAGLVLGHATLWAAASRFGVLPRFDIVSMVAVSIILHAVMALACTLPVRRAIRIDPSQVIKRT